MNPRLERVARFLSLYAADVGRAKRLDIVVVEAGAATRAMLADDTHRCLHSGGNPNALLPSGSPDGVSGSSSADRPWPSVAWSRRRRTPVSALPCLP